jgi:predicted PurR-regulated permease PerM
VERKEFIRRVAIASGFILLVLFISVLFTQALQTVLLLFGGVLFAVLLSAATDLLRKIIKLPRMLAYIVVVLLFFGLLAGGGWLLGPDIAEESAAVTEKLEQQVRSVMDQPWVRQLLGEDYSFDELRTIVLESLPAIFSSTLGAASAALIVLFVGLFLAAQPKLYTHGILRMFPISRRREVISLLHKLAHTLRWWLIGQMVSMLVLGTQITLGLWLLGVPLAVPLGVLTAILTFIPYLGPIIATVPAVLIGLSVSPEMGLWVLLLSVAVQNVEGYLITPIIHQKAVLLPAGLTIAAQVFLAMVAGPLGIILATPLLAVTFVLVRHIYVERLLGDSFKRPADAPPTDAREKSKPHETG